MARREPRRSPRFRCLLLELLEDDLLRLVLSQFEVRFDRGDSGRANGLQSENAECCRRLSLTCRRISVALCFSSSTRSLTEIPRSLAAVDDVLSSTHILLEEAAKLQAALRALPPEVYHEPAENTRAALQETLKKRGAMLAGARHRHAEDTKWLRRFEVQYSRGGQERPAAQAPPQPLPRAKTRRYRCTRATRRARSLVPDGRISDRTRPEGQEPPAARGWWNGLGGFVRRVHLLTANYVRNGYALCIALAHMHMHPGSSSLRCWQAANVRKRHAVGSSTKRCRIPYPRPARRTLHPSALTPQH